MKIISVANQKGGVGKTTTVVNLASALAIIGKRVLLIDLDAQGNASTSFGIEMKLRTHNIFRVFTEGLDINNAILQTEIPGLDIITSVIDLAGVDTILYGKKERELILKKHMESLHSKYDYVFIDNGPSLNILMVNALIASDSILIPVQCEFLAMEGIAYLMETIKLIRNTLNPTLEIEGILLTMFDKRNILCRQVQDEIRGEFRDMVYDITIPRNIKLPESTSHGKPAIVYDTKCLGSISYIMLAQEFLDRNKSIATKAS